MGINDAINKMSINNTRANLLREKLLVGIGHSCLRIVCIVACQIFKLKS
jgi:hypothetical protein